MKANQKRDTTKGKAKPRVKPILEVSFLYPRTKWLLSAPKGYRLKIQDVDKTKESAYIEIEEADRDG